MLHRCDADGHDIRELSSNNEHDNTPWPLPDGRILYTRWEYVDRNQVSFHHLWAANARRPPAERSSTATCTRAP